MPTIKIYPPTQLPDRKVSETQFSIWKEELEVYLSQEDDFADFLPGQRYANWVSAETNPDRVVALTDEHTLELRNHHNPNRREGVALPDLTAAQRDNALNKLRRSLRTVLSIIGKCVLQVQTTSKDEVFCVYSAAAS